MKFVSITIVTLQEGADHVSIETDVKEGVWPYTGSLSLTFRVARNQAEAYVAVNFPDVPVKKVVKGG